MSDVVSIHYDNVTNKLLYVLTSENLYVLDPEKITLTIEPVGGLKEGIVNATVIWQGRYILFNYRDELWVYENAGAKQVRLVQKIDRYDNAKVVVVDACVDSTELWLLD